MFRRLRPAGYILGTRNIAAPGQTRKLTDSLRELSAAVPIIAIDQAGGGIASTNNTVLAGPPAAVLAARGDMGKIAAAGVLTGELLSLLGFNLNLAPVLDLDHFPNTQNDMRGCCWGRDPQRVIDYAGHWNRWQRKRGIASCAKNFPAGGRAVSASRHDLPLCPATLAELQREDVIPYTALMPELDAIMVAHVGFPNIEPGIPASLSPRIVRRFLRDQLGFDQHLVLTDDLDLDVIARRYSCGDAVKLAIEAGNDLALICQRTATAEDAARIIYGLPRSLTAGARERIDNFRYEKLRSLPVWSDNKWHNTCAALAKLAAEFS